MRGKVILRLKRFYKVDKERECFGNSVVVWFLVFLLFFGLAMGRIY